MLNFMLVVLVLYLLVLGFICNRASFVFAININVDFNSVCETQPYNTDTYLFGTTLNFQFDTLRVIMGKGGI